MRVITKLFFIFTVLPAISAAAPSEEKGYCTSVLQASVFNYFLEEHCSFKGRVADKLDQEYKAKKCDSLFSKEEKGQLVYEALKDGRVRSSVYGKDEFCEANMEGYYNLIDYDF